MRLIDPNGACSMNALVCPVARQADGGPGARPIPGILGTWLSKDLGEWRHGRRALVVLRRDDPLAGSAAASASAWINDWVRPQRAGRPGRDAARRPCRWTR